MPARLRLLVFGPAWGAPSLDPACTKIVAWLRFCNMEDGRDFVLDACSNPHVMGMAGELPVLEIGGGDLQRTPDLAEPGDIVRALIALGHDVDAHLTAEQRAESLAFTALIEERLNLALLYSWWEDDANYDAVIRPALAAAMPLPLCYYLPWSMRRRVHSHLARRRCQSADTAYGMGEAALSALSVRLGTSDYIHCDSPSSIDASAFAYLTSILRCPLPHDRLRRALQSHTNLVMYCERISTAFFGGAPPLLPAVEPASHTSLTGSSVAGHPTAELRGAADASHRPTQLKKEPRTPKQERFRRRSRNAVVTAISGAVLYALAVDTFGSRTGEDEDQADNP